MAEISSLSFFDQPIREARASVATLTDAAPACMRARAAALAVAPVVKMSSTSSTCRMATAAGSVTVNAPRTFRRRCRGVSPAWLSVARSRISVLEASCNRQAGCVLRSDFKASAARDRAWLNPRCAYLARCNGTGITSISAGASPAICAIANAIRLPNFRAAPRTRSYFRA